ncbi:ATP-binding protein [Fredinandcohnia sp. 179-A 10B2 NHS]|uniref:ATP-binding protein n=1 Tax=Fredinandcohnia sp. 179-A 10B2 NHS TaxID=3235176 RepID=UPI0039A2CEC4
MRKINVHPLLLHEEKRAIKTYLFAFYVTLVLFDLFYYFFFKKYVAKVTPGFGNYLGYANYFFLLCLLVFSYFLFKKGNQHVIKYLHVAIYFSLAIIYDCTVFMEKPLEYASGNIAELILVLFSPIFINKRFFWFVSIGAISRYLIVGIVIHSKVVAIPTVLITVLAIIAYILLIRFSAYVNSLTKMHEELRHKEKLAFVGQMATTVGHEIKNPLSSLKGFTQLQREKYPEDQYYFSIMDQEIDRINAIVNDLLLLGKPKSSHFQQHQIRHIIDYVVSITEQQANKQNQKIVVEIDDGIPAIKIDDNQIKQVFINLIKNGLESMPKGGQLQIKVACKQGNWISICVIDQGSGISKEDMEHLFEPFFTTKNDGTGLGLMVSQKIIEDHNGKININSEVNKGTVMEVLLPITK